MQNNNFKIIDFISQLIKISPRQGENETKAACLITSTLKEYGVDCSVQKFFTKIPNIKKAVLTVDGKSISCKGTSFISGKIESKANLISSLTSSQSFLYSTNINFNPECKVISLANFYFAPSLAVSAQDLPKIIAAGKIRGEVKVEPLKHQSMNILVGNKVNPKSILFAHYDSIESGATDNASGVGTLMKMILSCPESLNNSLYVFSGNEELSYSEPIYWGYGFRVFERKFNKLFSKCKKVFVVDCVGNDKTKISHDKHLLNLAFPVKNPKNIQHKSCVVYGSMSRLMKVYHSDADTIGQLEEKYLNESVKKILSLTFC